MYSHVQCMMLSVDTGALGRKWGLGACCALCVHARTEITVTNVGLLQSLDAAIDPDSPAGGYAMGQIMYDVFLQRTGSPLWGIVLFATLPMLSVYTCSMSSYTYAAR